LENCSSRDACFFVYYALALYLQPCFVELLTMATFLNQFYGPTEGPLGFPVTDRQAFALGAILKALPKDDAFRYRKTVLARGASEVLTGERCDVSWITTEDPDRGNEVVVARGMNDGQFKHNPIVTMQHAYWMPPVGKSLWRKVVRDGTLHGIKAKTHYPVKPADWQAAWPPDVALALVQADLLRGKSIGFLPTKVHAPKDREREQPGWKDVDLVIDEWVLLEYACTFLPAQQHAVVEAVSKSLVTLPDDFFKAMNLDPALFTVGTSKATCEDETSKAACPYEPITPNRFTPLEEIEKAILRGIEAIDFSQLADIFAKEVLNKSIGRV
jgi:hypothetical protein